jgi:hypothetical protein
LELALFTLLHILVFVYWLGGDLGVFYSSTILTDVKVSKDGRIAAARILAQVDMAPRSAMILTLPTGATLADLIGWWELTDLGLISIWVGSLCWLALAWTIHLKHLPPSSMWRRADLLVRWLLVAGLLAAAALGPFVVFMKLKFAILAATILLGLWIRRALAPFGAAFGQMVSEGPSAQTDLVIARSLDHSRPAVIAIWVLLLSAALLGLAKPV